MDTLIRAQTSLRLQTGNHITALLKQITNAKKYLDSEYGIKIQYCIPSQSVTFIGFTPYVPVSRVLLFETVKLIQAIEKRLRYINRIDNFDFDFINDDIIIFNDRARFYKN